MKKKNAFVALFAMLVCVCMLAACSKSEGTEEPAVTAEATIVPTATPTATPTPTPEQPKEPAWKQGSEPVEGYPYQYTIGRLDVQNADAGAFFMCGDKLCRYSVSWNWEREESCEMYFEDISLDTGKVCRTRVLKPYEYNTYDGFICNDGMYGLYNYEKNTAVFFNKNHEIDHEIPMDGLYEYNIKASADGQKIFSISETELSEASAKGTRKVCDFVELLGIAKNDFYELQIEDVIGNGDYLSVTVSADKFSDTDCGTVFVDTTTGKEVGRLDYQASVSMAPDGSRIAVIPKGNDHNPRIYDTVTKKLLAELEADNSVEEFCYKVDWEHELIIVGKAYLNANDYYLWEMTAYDLNTCEKKCATVLSDDELSYYTIFEMNEKDGVLFLETKDLNDNRGILFWDYVNSDELETGKYFGKFGRISSELDNYRKEIEEKYGIFVYLGTEVSSTVFDFNVEVCTSERALMGALKTIDEAFSIYPRSLIDQIKFGSTKTLSIYLTGNIIQKYDYTISNAAAFVSDYGYERHIVLDVYEYDLDLTIYHEMVHWIDRFISARESKLGEYKHEDRLLALDPEGFDYKYTYVDYEADYRLAMDSCDPDEDTTGRYFIDTYAQTYPTEDRARTFEYLMKEDCDYFRCSNLRKKMQYICDAIRENFDTSDWPEKTVWEEKLEEVNIKYGEEPVLADVDITEDVDDTTDGADSEEDSGLDKAA